jgi:hypothetical protein
VSTNTVQLLTTKKNYRGWNHIRKSIEGWDRSAFIGLVKDLYEASPENRDFLNARFKTDGESTALETYREKIIEQFFPDQGFGKLKLAEARKAIRDFKRVSGNVAGVIDLMLTYVENGTKFTREFGDINHAYYNSLESVMNDKIKLLCKEGRNLYPRFRERILHLRTHAGHIGWGYGDYLEDQVGYLEGELGAEIKVNERT